MQVITIPIDFIIENDGEEITAVRFGAHTKGEHGENKNIADILPQADFDELEKLCNWYPEQPAETKEDIEAARADYMLDQMKDEQMERKSYAD